MDTNSPPPISLSSPISTGCHLYSDCSNFENSQFVIGVDGDEVCSVARVEEQASDFESTPFMFILSLTRV
jgi:hypothetical protein